MNGAQSVGVGNASTAWMIVGTGTSTATDVLVIGLSLQLPNEVGIWPAVGIGGSN
jgi:hypothetical protein